MRKKSFDWRKLLIMGSVPTLLGVILLFSRTVVTFADMPKRVDTIEQYIQAQQKMTEVQAEANNLMRQQIQQQTRPYCEIYEGTAWCFDEQTQQWYQPGG